MKPKIFDTHSILAILEGRKTQFREVVKESFNGCFFGGGPHPCPNEPVFVRKGEVIFSDEDEKGFVIDKTQALFHCSTLESEAFPKYDIDDMIYCREAWCDPTPDKSRYLILYKADFPVTYIGTLWDPKEIIVLKPEDYHWQSPATMPREGARIFLKVLDVRCERIQDISEDGAVSEGCIYGAGGREPDPAVSKDNHFPTKHAEVWQQNPWVFAYTFERVEKPEE